jgi:hypothetical protein
MPKVRASGYHRPASFHKDDRGLPGRPNLALVTEPRQGGQAAKE